MYITLLLSKDNYRLCKELPQAIKLQAHKSHVWWSNRTRRCTADKQWCIDWNYELKLVKPEWVLLGYTKMIKDKRKASLTWSKLGISNSVTVNKTKYKSAVRQDRCCSMKIVTWASHNKKAQDTRYDIAVYALDCDNWLILKTFQHLLHLKDSCFVIFLPTSNSVHWCTWNIYAFCPETECLSSLKLTPSDSKKYNWWCGKYIWRHSVSIRYRKNTSPNLLIKRT